jgi:hypothetical protein
MIQFQIISRGEDLSTIQENSLVDNLIVIDIHVYQFVIQTSYPRIEHFALFIGEQNVIEQLTQKIGKDKLSQYIHIHENTITFEPFMYFEDSAIGEVKITIEINDEQYSETVCVESRRVDKKQYAFMIETLNSQFLGENQENIPREVLFTRLEETIKNFCQFVQNSLPTLKHETQKKYYSTLFNPNIQLDSIQVRELAQKPNYLYSNGGSFLPRHVLAYKYEENYNIPENQYILHKMLEIKYRLWHRIYYIQQQELNLTINHTTPTTFIQKIVSDNIQQEKTILQNSTEYLSVLIKIFTELGIQPQKNFYHEAIRATHSLNGTVHQYYTQITDILYNIAYYQPQRPSNITVRNNWELFEQFTYIYMHKILSQIPKFKEATHKFEQYAKRKNLIFIKDEGTDNEERIELIYHFDQAENNPIGMFQSIHTQHNLTPDFVLKYSNSKTQKYFIMDSKFTFYKNSEDKSKELKDKYLNAFVTQENKYIDGVFAITPSYFYRLEVINSHYVSNKPRNYPVYGWITIPIMEFHKYQSKNIITDLISL